MYLLNPTWMPAQLITSHAGLCEMPRQVPHRICILRRSADAVCTAEQEGGCGDAVPADQLCFHSNRGRIKGRCQALSHNASSLCTRAVDSGHPAMFSCWSAHLTEELYSAQGTEMELLVHQLCARVHISGPWKDAIGLLWGPPHVACPRIGLSSRLQQPGTRYSCN